MAQGTASTATLWRAHSQAIFRKCLYDMEKSITFAANFVINEVLNKYVSVSVLWQYFGVLYICEKIAERAINKK